MNDLYEVPLDGVGGRLAVVGRPRGGDWLEDDLRRMRAAGVDVLVSALVREEERECWLLEEAELARAAGLEYRAFPIANLGTPGRHEGLEFFDDLAGVVRAGGFVAAHCRACVGRSPLIIASVMVLLGHEAATSWARIEQARGLAVPDTLEQRRWVAELAPSPRLDAIFSRDVDNRRREPEVWG